MPNRLSNHGRLGSPFAEVADSGGTNNAGHEPVQHSSNGWISDRLRKSTPWRYLPEHLDQRPRLGEVVCGPLPRLEQHQTSHVCALRGSQGGTGRAGRINTAVDPKHPSTTTQDGYQGKWEVIPKDDAQGQSKDGFGTSGGRHSSGGVGDRPGGLHAGAAGVGSRVSRCPTLGEQDVAYGKCTLASHRSPTKDHRMDATPAVEDK